MRLLFKLASPHDRIHVVKYVDKKILQSTLYRPFSALIKSNSSILTITKRVLVVSGVESAEPDLKSSQVTVKGVFEPPKLVEYVHRRTGKQAVIVKVEPEKKEEEKPKDAKEEKKAEEGGGGGGGGDKKSEGEGKDKKEGDAAAEPKAEAAEEGKVVEMKKSEYHFYPPQFYSSPTYLPMDFYAPPPQPLPPPPPPYYYNQALMYAPYNPYPPQTYPPPPQIFSDENPNACSVM